MSADHPRLEMVEDMEMTKHCDTKTSTAFAAPMNDDQFTPFAEGGCVIRYRLEAAEV
jgi:hypothetical protein